MNDQRIWVPDETCEFWDWDIAIQSAGGSLGNFRVPPDSIAILAMFSISSQNAVAKEIARWNLCPESPTAAPIPLNGSITEVAELSSTGANIPGLSLSALTGPRPLYKKLDSGVTYFVVQTGNAGQIVHVSLWGWAFRPHR